MCVILVGGVYTQNQAQIFLQVSVGHQEQVSP